MIYKISCCQKCTEGDGRSSTCHATCKQYKKEKFLHELSKKKARKVRESENLYIPSKNSKYR